ncbi:MAG: hypothetical protein ABR512_16510, partial [Desulfopila sp.]
MKQGRMLLKAAIFGVTLLSTATFIQAQYESKKKMGIPEDVDPVHATYIPVVSDQDFETMMKKDQEMKAKIMDRQKQLLERRYDLSDNPSDVMM